MNFRLRPKVGYKSQTKKLEITGWTHRVVEGRWAVTTLVGFVIGVHLHVLPVLRVRLEFFHAHFTFERALKQRENNNFMWKQQQKLWTFWRVSKIIKLEYHLNDSIGSIKEKDF